MSFSRSTIDLWKGQMKIPVWKIFCTLVICSIVIIACHSLAVLSYHFTPGGFPESITALFNVNAEANLPTWYSSALLFFVALAAFFLFLLESGQPRAQQMGKNFWFGFGMVYLFLSLDESATVHEFINALTGIKWVYLYAPFGALFFLACLYYCFVVDRNNVALRYYLVGGLILYALGGLVCEWISYNFHLKYALQQIEYVMEEWLELIGTTLVLMGCLREVNHKFTRLLLRETAQVRALPIERKPL